jgi:hypothetical protein
MICAPLPKDLAIRESTFSIYSLQALQINGLVIYNSDTQLTRARSGFDRLILLEFPSFTIGDKEHDG